MTARAAGKALLFLLFLFTIATAGAQSWTQWGQNARHTGAVAVAGQKPERILGQFTYDPLADEIRGNGALLVHYMAPLTDAGDVFTMSRGESGWKPCGITLPPCGAALWGQMQWGITKLRGPGLEKQWTAITEWKPPPADARGWEPVFHPALAGGYVYAPGGAGSVVKLDRQSGAVVATLQPFGEDDPNRYVTSPLTVDAAGAIYYTALRLDAGAPWNSDVKEAWLVKIDAAGVIRKVSFSALVPANPAAGCVTSFAGQQLPWPPSADAKAPVGSCGSQRPGMNAAPAVGADGTVYVVSRAHFNAAYGYLVAINADLTPRWSASLRGRLSDGCDVLLPPNGTVGGCRDGSPRGVDPTTNEMPAGSVEDQSTASPVVAPDGSILYGAASRYNYARGHLFRFSAGGEFLAAYDFGWDITPAIYEHDGTWSAIVKDNFYAVGSYCDVLGYCGQSEPRYNISSLTPELRREWAYQNSNDRACAHTDDGGFACVNATEGFEWCVNMVAVDREGVVYANSEDGNVYAIDRAGKLIRRLFLKTAIGAAYTPLALGADGVIYTQNDGTLFAVGQGGPRRLHSP